MLDEVHFLPNGSLSYNVVVRLEHLETQLGQHGRHKVWLGVGKQRHGRHQLATVEVYDFLREGHTDLCINGYVTVCLGVQAGLSTNLIKKKTKKKFCLKVFIQRFS